MTDDEKKLIALFKKYGTSKDDLYVIQEKSVHFSSQDEMMDSEIETFASHSKRGRLLQTLNDSPDTPTSEIAQALGIEESEVTDLIAELRKDGLLSKQSLTLTTKGENVMKELPFTTEITLVYNYQVAPGLGPSIIDGSREFCREMVAMNKVWSMSDIQNLSVEYGYDIWERRGGFWRHKGTDTTTPYCRHIWAQQIVRKKI